MKLSISLFFSFLIAIVFSLNSLALSESKVLTPKEERHVVTLLNNFCGDAWCEGIYDIEFKTIVFNDKNHFYIIAAATTADASDELTAVSISFECEIKNPSIILDTVKSRDEEALFLAETRLFETVTQCIDTALYSKFNP